MNIYHDILENNYKAALILEDDVLFGDEFLKFLSPAEVNRLPTNWDMIRIGHTNLIPFHGIAASSVLVLYLLAILTAHTHTWCRILGYER